MVNQEHLDLLKQGTAIWNRWREEHPDITPDLKDGHLASLSLKEINFSFADLSFADLSFTDLSFADLRGANLYNASLVRTALQNADLSGADLSGADLSGAKLSRVDLSSARLGKAILNGADLSGADLSGADLSGANLSNSDLSSASLIKTNLQEADLTGSTIYGISALNVNLEGAKQLSLVITDRYELTISVDTLEVAQFISLLLNNQGIRGVIDTITTKVVLVLGRFTGERKAILDALTSELRKLNYSPAVLDFEKPGSRDSTETVFILASLSRFIIVDLTEPSSIPQELQAIVPNRAIPVQPLLFKGKREYAMFVDFIKTYHWVLPVHYYLDQASLLMTLKEKVIEPAEQKAKELEKR